MPSNREMSQLQEMLLRAVLSGQSLPGQDQPIRLPDLPFVLRQPVIYLADANLSGPVALDDSPKPVRILPVAALAQEAQKQGEIAYLQFQPLETTGDSVRLVLEARMAAGDANKQALGLSSVQVKFSKQGDEWKVVDEPVYSAA